VLEDFYVTVRTSKGEHYKKSSVLNMRHGLNRHLKKHYSGGDIDIIKDTEFQDANKYFKAVTKELKRIGKGDVDHHEPLSNGDLEKCYKYFSKFLFSSEVLQEKVFFDLLLYLARRGRENLRELTKDHFEIGVDSSRNRYVYKKQDEDTKNHKLDSESFSGRMVEVKGDAMCPVRSFETYIASLDTNSNILFQVPIRNANISLGQSYLPKPIGARTLGDMMARISRKAGTSVMYTNHCLRATTVTVLDTAGVPSRHIMNVTGHRSENSLKTYSHRSSENMKNHMSSTISKSVGLQEVSVPKQSVACAGPSPSVNVVLSPKIQAMSLSKSAPVVDVIDWDASMINDEELATVVIPPQQSTFNMNHLSSVTFPQPSISNCNVTINYNFYQKP
jgi:hypothetical protein